MRCLAAQIIVSSLAILTVRDIPSPMWPSGQRTPRWNQTYSGFSGVTEGKISNLHLNTVSIHGKAKNVSGYVIGLAGGLIGSASGSVENCHVTGLTMTMKTPDSGWAAAYWIGGLVGASEAEQIDECSVSGMIREEWGKGSIGGLIGELGKASKITYSRANVALDVKPDHKGGADVGGFIGRETGKAMLKRLFGIVMQPATLPAARTPEVLRAVFGG